VAGDFVGATMIVGLAESIITPVPSPSLVGRRVSSLVGFDEGGPVGTGVGASVGFVVG